MTCASCEAHVNHEVNKLNGIVNSKHHTKMVTQSLSLTKLKPMNWRLRKQLTQQVIK